MSESHHQGALIQWWDMSCTKYGLPKEALFAIPNGGARTAITGSRMKREGVRRGVFDLALPVPRNGLNGLWIELKHGKNKLSAEQEQFKAFMEGQRAKCIVCWNWEDAKQEIENYLRG